MLSEKLNTRKHTFLFLAELLLNPVEEAISEATSDCVWDFANHHTNPIYNDLTHPSTSGCDAQLKEYELT